MRKQIKSLVLATALTFGVSGVAQAQDLNVAFFLEWPTPNQIAKVDKVYDEALGVDVNWVDFSTGVAMTEAMLAGDIDISYSQGLAPFVTAIQQGAPIKMVGIAVVYEANDCFVHDNAGIDATNASELEGKTVAVPLNTMADYSFRLQMAALNVDIDTLTIVDQAPPDGAASLVDEAVAMACIFGGNSAKIAGEVGTPIMSTQQKADAGIGSFDVISVTESFATANPDLVREFLEVTDEANSDWRATNAQLRKVAQDAGMSVEDVKNTLKTFSFPSVREQRRDYFGRNGIAVQASESLGAVFDGSSNIELRRVIDGSFLR